MTKTYLKEMKVLLDIIDHEVLQRLANLKRCQSRILAPGDPNHYIYCGAYPSGSKNEEAVQLKSGRWTCCRHRQNPYA